MEKTAVESGIHLVSTAEVIGEKVFNLAGEELGQIEELMLDPEAGRIAFAVLSFGLFLGLGDRRLALPFEALRLHARHDCFVLAVDPETLKGAPDIDLQNPPKGTDRVWGGEIYEHYGYRPYWQ